MEKVDNMKTNPFIFNTRHKKLGFLDLEINVRGILSAFHIGIAGYDVDKVMSMMGIEGASSFERNFSRHSHKILAVIRDIYHK